MKQLFRHRQSGMISRVHDIDQQQHFGQVHLPVWTQRFTAPDWKRRQQHRIHQVIQAALLPEGQTAFPCTENPRYLGYQRLKVFEPLHMRLKTALFSPVKSHESISVCSGGEKESFHFKLLFWEDFGFSIFPVAFCLVGSCSQANKESGKWFHVHKHQMYPHNLSPHAHLIVRQSRSTISREEI